MSSGRAVATMYSAWQQASAVVNTVLTHDCPTSRARGMRRKRQPSRCAAQTVLRRVSSARAWLSLSVAASAKVAGV